MALLSRCDHPPSHPPSHPPPNHFSYSNTLENLDYLDYVRSVSGGYLEASVRCLGISWTKIFFWTIDFWTNIFLDQKFYWIKNFLDQTFFWTEIFFGPKFFWTQNFFWDKNFFWDQNFLGPKFFWTSKYFWTPKYFWSPKKEGRLVTRSYLCKSLGQISSF